MVPRNTQTAPFRAISCCFRFAAARSSAAVGTPRAGVFAEGLPALPLQAASAPGATTPTARAVRTRRRLIDGKGLAGLTWNQGT